MTVLVTIVIDGVGTVFVLSAWYLPLPRRKGTRERFIQGPFYKCAFGIQNYKVFCLLWVGNYTMVCKHISVIGQTGGNTCFVNYFRWSKSGETADDNKGENPETLG